jgi:hypothetical protein
MQSRNPLELFEYVTAEDLKVSNDVKNLNLELPSEEFVAPDIELPQNPQNLDLMKIEVNDFDPPKVNTNITVPEVNIDNKIPSQTIDVALETTIPNVEITSFPKDVNLPEISSVNATITEPKGPAIEEVNVESNVKELKFEAPNFETNHPEIQIEDIKANTNVPNLKPPEINVENVKHARELNVTDIKVTRTEHIELGDIEDFQINSNLPDIKAPEVESPKVERPKVEDLEINTNLLDMNVLEVEGPKVESPKVEDFQISTNLPEVKSPEVEITEAETPKFDNTFGGDKFNSPQVNVEYPNIKAPSLPKIENVNVEPFQPPELIDYNTKSKLPEIVTTPELPTPDLTKGLKYEEVQMDNFSRIPVADLNFQINVPEFREELVPQAEVLGVLRELPGIKMQTVESKESKPFMANQPEQTVKLASGTTFHIRVGEYTGVIYVT